MVFVRPIASSWYYTSACISVSISHVVSVLVLSVFPCCQCLYYQCFHAISACIISVSMLSVIVLSVFPCNQCLYYQCFHAVSACFISVSTVSVGQDHGGTMSDGDGGTRSWWDNV